MKKVEYNEKVSLIKKYFKKEKQFLELEFINYERFNIYICMNETKKGVYKLYWFDLDSINDKDIEKYISCQYVPVEVIENIKEDFSTFNVSLNYHDEFLTNEDTVTLRANIATKIDKSIDVSFKKYLPSSLSHLSNLFVFVFKSMSKRFELFLYEVLAKLTSTTERYEYKKEFEFDLFNGDIDKLFEYQIAQRGKKYYEESRIQFLEKIDDRYFAIVEGTEKYLVIVKYKEEEGKMQVYCSCPCEFYCKHIYAVILAIRNEEFNRFYKIMYKNPNKDLLDRIMNFDYLLCLGVVEQNLEIINDYGEIELVPILDVNGKYNWEVLEDTEDEKLMKQIKYFLDNQ